MRPILFPLITLLCLIGCKRPVNTQSCERSVRGYHYRLLDFDGNEKIPTGSLAWVNAVFATQDDSVFWTSDDNLNAGYVVLADSAHYQNPLQYHVSISSPGDSVMLLVPRDKFFREFFSAGHSPSFASGDSLVKVFFAIKKILDPGEEQRIRIEGKKREFRLIRACFPSDQAYEAGRDENGIFWLSPRGQKQNIKPGQRLCLSIRCSYLSGRPLTSVPQRLTIEYGVPDQLVSGLNYVIPFLNLGENAKIILPSRLAFGEFGSSNGMIPPFTPLMFEVARTPDNPENN